MTTLIINADDFGLTRGVNDGIIKAHTDGIVNSTTLLVNMPGTKDAVRKMKDYPDLGVGIHLTLSCGSPVRSDVPSLVNEEGSFKLTKTYREVDPKEINVSDVEKEWRAQLQTFLSFGIYPTHIDSHHHIHGWDPLYPVIHKLSKEYSLPVRNVFQNTKSQGIQLHTAIFRDDFYKNGTGLKYFHKLQKEVSTEEVVEVMVHPGFIDDDLRNISSFLERREKELELLTAIQLPKGMRLAERRNREKFCTT
ncbi:chitin disaccharide deacetylase [Thalassorhabdus alkalitolerans]|uniref:Carbohydrate deacetylase n=1 Tax=Thalassorhabdus alkalitolerans TaxID=2282697 RepID=A0ABW0YH04_9BACI